MQAKRGALFFIPRKYRSDYYSYHKTKTELVRLKIDFNLLECSICLKAFYENDVELTDRSTSQTERDLIDDDCYDKLMVTPCKHVFHTECLGKWVVVRMECPVCKQRLPFIE
jgi:hypothetical protein